MEVDWGNVADGAFPKLMQCIFTPNERKFTLTPSHPTAAERLVGPHHSVVRVGLEACCTLSRGCHVNTKR